MNYYLSFYLLKILSRYYISIYMDIIKMYMNIIHYYADIIIYYIDSKFINN